jgi:HPt (histidine-containing phosphotransfer) domain-containing protein
MPSRSRAAANEPIDLDHLRKVTLSDPAVERDVLRLFVDQTATLMQTLAALPDNAAALAHTLKGSARAIGAFRMAESAAALEGALCRQEDAREALAQLGIDVREARLAATALLERLER